MIWFGKVFCYFNRCKYFNVKYGLFISIKYKRFVNILLITL